LSSTLLPLDQIITGDCLQVLQSLPENSIDLVFADPPYNLQLRGDLWRPNMTRVDAVDDEWDRFETFQAYDDFSRQWLTACRRLLKEHGTLWVIGTYHNIYRLGAILQDLGFWFLNDVVWVKTNPMPNFHGVRFTNAHETLLWVSKTQGARYTFNHQAMKALNDDLQMRSDWLIPICSGPERLKVNGVKLHATQKPEALLYRILLASSNPGDVILDPFFGSGTTGVVAKKLHRHWIGIESQAEYVQAAQARIDAAPAPRYDPQVFEVGKQARRQERLPFGALLEHGLLAPGQTLYFRGDRTKSARLAADARLLLEGFSGSIHMAGRHMLGGSPCNGWDVWYYEDQGGKLHPIDKLRQRMRDQMAERPSSEAPPSARG